MHAYNGKELYDTIYDFLDILLVCSLFVQLEAENR